MKGKDRKGFDYRTCLILLWAFFIGSTLASDTLSTPFRSPPEDYGKGKKKGNEEEEEKELEERKERKKKKKKRSDMQGSNLRAIKQGFSNLQLKIR